MHFYVATAVRSEKFYLRDTGYRSSKWSDSIKLRDFNDYSTGMGNTAQESDKKQIISMGVYAKNIRIAKITLANIKNNPRISQLFIN